MSTGGVTGILSTVGSLTGSALTNTTSAIVNFFSTTKRQTQTALNDLLQVSNDAKAADDAITKLSEVSGLQSSIMNLVPAMRAAVNNPVTLAQLVSTAQLELNN